MSKPRCSSLAEDNVPTQGFRHAEFQRVGDQCVSNGNFFDMRYCIQERA